MKFIIFIFAVALFGCYISSVDATSRNFNTISWDDVEEDDGNNESSYEISVYDAKDNQENDSNVIIIEHGNNKINNKNIDINPYEGKILYFENGWKIVQSPLKKSRFVNSGLEVYVNGDESSEEIIIDVERSLASSDYFIIRLYNAAIDMASFYWHPSHELTYQQCVVMLGLAGEIPYEWGSKYIYPLVSPWKLNYDHLMHRNNIEMIVKKFKNKFPNCKNIKLNLINKYQKILLTYGYTLNYFYKALRENDLRLIGEDDLEIETNPKVKLINE